MEQLSEKAKQCAREAIKEMDLLEAFIYDNHLEKQTGLHLQLQSPRATDIKDGIPKVGLKNFTTGIAQERYLTCVSSREAITR